MTHTRLRAVLLHAKHITNVEFQTRVEERIKATILHRKWVRQLGSHRNIVSSIPLWNIDSNQLLFTIY